jgi:hypothetical protein
MKTDRLEDFVQANRNEFDFREPSPEVWERISENSKIPRRFRIGNYFLRVAAIIILVVVTSAVLWRSNVFTPGSWAKNIQDPELRELIEAEAYYAHQVNSKLKEIRKCYYTFPELKQDVENDLTELEEMYKVLKNDLKENVSNKTVIEAMIENNRYRLKLVDDVLEQINC